MDNRIMKHWALRAAAALTVLGPCMAWATLGEPELSVKADGQQLHGSVKLQQRGAYRVHEIQLESGTTLREFVGADGTVFAVAWKGPSTPNLRQALGNYFGAYVDGAKVNHQGRGRLEIHQDNFVAQAAGHMRAFTGRAYLPLALPAGVAIGDIR